MGMEVIYECDKCKEKYRCEVGYFARLPCEHKIADGSAKAYYPIKVIGIKHKLKSSEVLNTLCNPVSKIDNYSVFEIDFNGTKIRMLTEKDVIAIINKIKTTHNASKTQ